MEGQVQSTSESPLPTAASRSSKYELSADVMADIAKMDSGNAPKEAKAVLTDTETDGQAEAAEDSTEGETDISLESLGLEAKPLDESAEEATTETAPTDGIEIVVAGEKKIVPMAEVKERLQKEFDYTRKTMELAEEKKSFEKQFAEKEQNLKEFIEANQSEIYTKQQFDSFVEHLQAEDPEYYSDLQARAARFNSQMNNPFWRSEMARMQEQINGVNQLKQELEKQKYVGQFEREFQEFEGAYKDKWAKLGFKLGENEMKELKSAWAKHSVTGMNVQQVFNALYSDKLSALLMSKGALNKTKQMAQKKAPTLGSIKPSSNPVGQGGGPKVPRGAGAYAALAKLWVDGQLK